GRDFENSPIVIGPAFVSCSVEVPVRALHQPSPRVGSVEGTEAVQRSHRARRGDFENRAIAVGPATVGCSIELSVRSLHQASIREGAVTGLETVQRSNCSRGDYKKNAI